MTPTFSLRIRSVVIFCRKFSEFCKLGNLKWCEKYTADTGVCWVRVARICVWVERLHSHSYHRSRCGQAAAVAKFVVLVACAFKVVLVLGVIDAQVVIVEALIAESFKAGDITLYDFPCFINLVVGTDMGCLCAACHLRFDDGFVFSLFLICVVVNLSFVAGCDRLYAQVGTCLHHSGRALDNYQILT